jgi:nitronate monooxygenase
VKATEEDTVLLFRNLHNTARVFKNKTASQASTIEKDKGKDIKFTDLMELVAGSRGMR